MKWNYFSSVCRSQPTYGQSQPAPQQMPQPQPSARYNRRLNKRVHRLKNDDELDDETEFVYKGTNKENSLPHFNITIGATRQVLSFLAGLLSAYFSKQTLNDCLQSRKWRNLGPSYQPMTPTNPYQYGENSKPFFVQETLHAEPQYI